MVPTPERTSPELPFVLLTGRSLHQFNAGTMTMRTPNRVLRPTDFLDVSREDAERLGLRDGEQVRVTSRYGEAVLPCRVDGSVRPKMLAATPSEPTPKPCDLCQKMLAGRAAFRSPCPDCGREPR